VPTTWCRGVVFTVAILASVASASEAQEPAPGAHLFHQYCASCHEERGTGDGPMSTYLRVKPSDLTRITARRKGKFPREPIARIIAGEEEVPGHGTRTMPVWGERLQDDVIGGVSKPTVARGRIAFLVDHLEALQGTAEKGLENIVIPGSGPRPGLGPRP
jgi:mono/diheme cytochrome c family protein